MTAKFAALALEPMAVPPVDTVYQLMLLPVDVAFKLEEPGAQIEAGEAVTGLGVAGVAFTVTTKLAQPVVLHVPSALTK